MLQYRCWTAALVVGCALAAAALGWLDRVVRYQRDRFLGDLRDLAPVNITVELRPKPAGFQDSADWDYDSVLRLLTLIRGSETEKSLRRMLRPTRRYKLSKTESMRWFPSIAKDHIYYDVGYSSSEEDPHHNPLEAGHHMLYISNPVESRLPSGSISVDRLKRILEEKARLLREMPVDHHDEAWFATPKAKQTTPKSTDTTSSAACANTTDSQPLNGTDAPPANGVDTTTDNTLPGANDTNTQTNGTTTTEGTTTPGETPPAA